MRFDVYSTELNYVNEGIEDSPKNYVYHLLKANTLYNQHLLEESLLSFNKAIELQPNRVQAYANRANVYIMLGEKELALADLNNALRIDSNPNLFLNRFNAYYVFKDYDNALKDMETLKKYKGVFTLDIPDDVRKTLERYSREKEATHKTEEATKILGSANDYIRNDPKNASLYVHRAKAFVDLKRWKEALADLKKACDLEPGNQEYKDFYTALNNSMPH